MNAPNTSASPSAPGSPATQGRGDPLRTRTFLVLGGALPDLPGARFHAEPAQAADAILLAGPVSGAELSEALAVAPDPAVPIADFGANHGLRRDFAGEALSQPALAMLSQQFAPIWRRLADLPFHAARESRGDLSLLRLAFSRDTAIRASLAADTRLLVEYPLLGREAGLRQRLEALGERGLLHRTHFTRTHACHKCDSARLHAYEACPACGGGELVDELVVHHYRCGWQEPESRFIRGHGLACPKCRRELRHFGVDYDKPGSVVVCAGCGAANTDPVPCFACLDCEAVTPASSAAATDWYHYGLTEDGLQALRDQRVPLLDIAAYVHGWHRVFPRRDFLLLVSEAMRVARRYERPFALGRIAIGNFEALHRAFSAAEIDQGFRIAVDIMIESLRESDFVGPDGATAALIGFPETSAADAASVFDRLRLAIAEAVSIPFDFEAQAVDGDAVEDMAARHLGGADE